MSAEQTRDELIGESLRQARGDRSQEVLAAEMREQGWRWTQATVWSVEIGKRPLRFAEAVDLSETLGIPILRLASAPDHLGMALQRARTHLHQAEVRASKAGADLLESQRALKFWEAVTRARSGKRTYCDLSFEEVMQSLRIDPDDAVPVLVQLEVADDADDPIRERIRTYGIKVFVGELLGKLSNLHLANRETPDAS